MKKIILILILLSSCSYNQNKNVSYISDIKFSDSLSLEEFKTKLDKYTQNNPYPNIDN